ncbi:hypothetical protein CCY99_00215 [Helicobacter sp. 16-1353]|uniref:hypothetical protein n=1 Tax=Helicobacter sp. 16-1353 TaxID=2004996 RepID=UPI000DCE5844|nr:hypothetical protein [Helicobacter sp. 16-1353]RAX55159.1 hypothetical protein CCY99_00215 [Helicobacter sp. 16-1353]
MDYSKLGEISKLNNKIFPFKEVVKNIEKCEVLKFDNDELLNILKTACSNTITPVNNIEFSARPNEFGNIVANLFAVECRNMQLEYQKPKNSYGKDKESGYPDGLLVFKDKYYYIELKTCEESKQNQTLRTFFYSPSQSSKIIYDAPHLLICFLTTKKNNILLLNGNFHIVDMYEKNVKLKLEYNSNNKELYGGKLL